MDDNEVALRWQLWTPGERGCMHNSGTFPGPCLTFGNRAVQRSTDIPISHGALEKSRQRRVPMSLRHLNPISKLLIEFLLLLKSLP
ncbi:hypothetical protein CC2G_011439 [Coprinopsis cinerea AmutBmut pab1-1]|nr:hypothetical protein CC2G_011439 [Coprinopsis cinerea AmutBmut pab1-1]